jgi:hypothetical protein
LTVIKTFLDRVKEYREKTRCKHVEVLRADDDGIPVSLI